MKMVRKGAIALICMLATPLLAQPGEMDGDTEEMQRSVSVFAGVLRESLDLDVRQSVFNPRVGEVSGRYLVGQGVVMELMTPLRSGRSSISLRSLQSSLEELSQQLSGMAAGASGLIRRPDTGNVRDAMALSLRRDEAGEFYREMLEQLSDMEAFQIVDHSLRLAANSARSLYNLDEMSETAFEQLNEELMALRGQLTERLAELESLQAEVRAAGLDADSSADEREREHWRQMLEELQERLPELREQAMEKARELRERSEELRQSREQEWRADVEAFERRLFGVLCDYGASLRTLPDDEYLTIVLPDLGESGDAGQQSDRIHVLEKSQLLRCQRGDIDAAALMAQASSYSF